MFQTKQTNQPTNNKNVIKSNYKTKKRSYLAFVCFFFVLWRKPFAFIVESITQYF